MLKLPGQRAGRTAVPRNILDHQEGISYGRGVIDSDNAYDGANTGYEDEIREGTPLAKITASKLFVPCKRSAANGQGVASQALIVNDARAFKVGETVAIKGAARLLKVADLDAAAATGVAVYVHLDELGESPVGHLECVNAGNADSSFQLLNGAVVKVEDDDAAATGGVALYIDEDAANPDERLLANLPTGKDCFILASDGTPIRVKYNATPGTPGVQVYFDDDGATVTERLLFVSPTNASAVVKSETSEEYPAPTNLVTRSSGNTVTAINYGTNTITLTTAANWTDDDQVICDSLPGSEAALMILEEFVKCRDLDTNSLSDVSFSHGIMAGGILKSSMILGDLTAIRASSDNKLSKIGFDTDHGQA